MTWIDLTPVKQPTAEILAALGYSEDTPYIWDRHNPRNREGGKLSDPELAWKLSPSTKHYDYQCCLRAPSKLSASLFLLKKAWDTLWRG